MAQAATCGDACGWLAAVIGAVCSGSYGVPIKATLDVDVHPLVLQSYKTIVLFVFSWSVLLIGEQARWTGYGILSGFLYVVGGTFSILGIRLVGMAVAVGTWASVMVLVNFVWGILVFHEPIHSFVHTCIAFAALCGGLVGMSRYSAGSKVHPGKAVGGRDDVELVEGRSEALSSKKRVDEELEPMLTVKGEEHKRQSYSRIAGIPFTQRQTGILCSVMTGVLSGSSLIPMHFAKAQGFMGRSYILSLGCGGLLANLIIWFGYFCYMYHRGSEGTTLRSTYDLMPSFHWKELWFRGLMAGLLLTFGMFGALFAVTFLGQAIGNSLVQSKIFISGLWGIFWFKEVKDPKAIGKWFASAALCVGSILWLSYERTMAKALHK